MCGPLFFDAFKVHSHFLFSFLRIYVFNTPFYIDKLRLLLGFGAGKKEAFKVKFLFKTILKSNCQIWLSVSKIIISPT